MLQFVSWNTWAYTGVKSDIIKWMCAKNKKLDKADEKNIIVTWRKECPCLLTGSCLIISSTHECVLNSRAAYSGIIFFLFLPLITQSHRAPLRKKKQRVLCNSSGRVWHCFRKQNPRLAQAKKVAYVIGYTQPTSTSLSIFRVQLASRAHGFVRV